MSPMKPRSRCSNPTCRRLHQGTGLCAPCAAARERQIDARRGSAADRGYGPGHQRRFRPGVLTRDPRCVCTDTSHGHRDPCGQPSTQADHYPLSRRELVARGLDPDDPAHGRGLCGPCHSRETAKHQPGGWNRTNSTKQGQNSTPKTPQ